MIRGRIIHCEDRSKIFRALSRADCDFRGAGLMTLALKTCLREPIAEIADAARLLDQAVTAHLEGRHEEVRVLLRIANIGAIRDWTESLWGAKSDYAPRGALAPRLTAEQRAHVRMPNGKEQRVLHERDGFHCRFCGIPVIRAAVRQRFRKLYPDLSLWGRSNIEQHAAFQAMWAQYDHVVPHASGGTNDLDNLVVTCAPCNYGRMHFTLEEAGLLDPRMRRPVKSAWDGLERFR